MLVLERFLLVTAFIWWGIGVYNLVERRRIPRLSKPPVPPEFGPNAPLVSILVPARNEAERLLEPAIRSLLAQTYPQVEVVAVNDRSTDDTGLILERLAAEDSRLRVIQGKEPPLGWLGKPHALHQAAAAAHGEWLLATDADVLFAPETVATAMAEVQARKLDALTLLPRLGQGGFGVRAVMPMAIWDIQWIFPVSATNNPRSRRPALGCGAFFLLRRTALEAIGGYEAVRNQVAEDVAVATALKRAGWRLRIAGASDLLYTPMYANLRDIWYGFGKNAFAGSDFRVGRAVRGAAMIFLFAVLPLLLTIAGGMAWAGGAEQWREVTGAAALAYLSMVLAYLPAYRAFGVSGAYAFLSGLAQGFMGLVSLYSMWRTVTGRGVSWRGRTVYRR
ncbi:MAG TPA: glycosyltransferase [Armatimonadetes bacterium]|nr:glycosyltransferase [Armatimonadota bacterium]